MKKIPKFGSQMISSFFDKKTHKLPMVRLELATPGLQTQCSNHWAIQIRSYSWEGVELIMNPLVVWDFTYFSKVKFSRNFSSCSKIFLLNFSGGQNVWQNGSFCLSFEYSRKGPIFIGFKWELRKISIVTHFFLHK